MSIFLEANLNVSEFEDSLLGSFSDASFLELNIGYPHMIEARKLAVQCGCNGAEQRSFDGISHFLYELPSANEELIGNQYCLTKKFEHPPQIYHFRIG